MPIDWIYRGAVPVGISPTSLQLTVQPCLMMSEDPPPPQDNPTIHHFGHAGLCRPHSKQIDQFEPSYYQFESFGLCRAQDPMGCTLTGSKEMLCLLQLPQLHGC